MQRYFLVSDQLPTADQFTLPATDPAFHHFVTVMRARVDSQAEFVFAGATTVIVGRVTAVTASSVMLAVVQRAEQQVELARQVTLVVSPLKGDRTDWLVQKATELGARRIIVTAMARSVVDWRKQWPKKQQRLQKISQAAAEQSHRLVVPEILWCSWEEVCQRPKAAGLVAWEESARDNETHQLTQTVLAGQAGDELCCVFGPEGGLTNSEVAQLMAADYHPAGLGPRILRAETAPLYALSAISVLTELT